MKIAEAKEGIGKAVVYRPHPGASLESGVITGASSVYVFVRFDGDRGSKACSPESLSWEAAR